MAATKVHHRCDHCFHQDATYEAQTRRATTDAFSTVFLCDECTHAATMSDDPPRKVTPLTSTSRPRQRLDEPRLGDDWGRQ